MKPGELALQRAWMAYYTTMRDDPDATDEQRERAAEMLAKTALYPRAAAEAISVDDLA